MHVVQFSTAHHASDTRIFHKEAQSLSDAGHDVTLIAQHDGADERDGVRIAGIRGGDSRVDRFRSIPHVYRHAKAMDADVYHFHDPELLGVGLALSVTTDAKIVYDVHEDFNNQIQFKDWIPDVVKPVVANSIVPIQSLCARRFDAIVAANEWIAETFEARGHDVTVVGNFPITNEITIADYAHERDHEYVLSFVGNVDGTRGFIQMLEVTSRLRGRGYDVGLWVIGPILDDIEREANAFMQREGIEDAVRLFGFVDYAELFSYLAASDIGMMLVDQDLYEYGLSNKMFEYMYAELPVIATSTTSTRKYIPEACGVHLESDGDVQAQADAVAGLLDRSADERAEMGARGREHVLENCCWEMEAEKLIELYRTL